MQAKLIPKDKGQTINVTKDVTVVGRKDGVCDLIVDHPSISKLHCIIAKTDGLLFIRDLGSTNGTKVNGQRVLRGALLPGDELAFAKIKFQVFLGPDEEPDSKVVRPSEATEMITGLEEAETPHEQLRKQPEEDSDFFPLKDDE